MTNKALYTSLATAFLLCLALPSAAQRVQEDLSALSMAGNEVQVDSSLLGRDIYSLLDEDLVLRQSPQIRSSLNALVDRNSGTLYNGFRIRIFIDSSRSAREKSLSEMRRFNEQYPSVMAYRSYDAPNFKVSVGNFRNRVEAEAFLRKVKSSFPDAFVVRERFKYPSLSTDSGQEPGINKPFNRMSND